MSQQPQNQQPQQPAEPEILEDVAQPSSAIALLAKAEIDMQIATAHAFPRSLKTFKDKATSMATLDEDTAASCFYSVPRSGKDIEGPSARMAEIVAAAWGNLRFGGRMVAVDDKFVTSQGVCHDLENNVAVTMEVQRRITTKTGKRFNDDMIVMTANAAASIALRNAVFKIVPKALWNPVYLAARQVAIGDARTLSSRRAQSIGYFKKMGVTEPQILSVLERKSVEDIDLDDLLKLRGLATAIKEGDTSIEDAFAVREKADDKPPLGKHSLKTEPPKQEPAKSEEKPRTNGSSKLPHAVEHVTEVVLDQMRTEMRRLKLGGEWVNRMLADHGVKALAQLTLAQGQAILTRLVEEPDQAAETAKAATGEDSLNF